jgi:photosystem II stability/assembly factor-like uncharacterized protein
MPLPGISIRRFCRTVAARGIFAPLATAFLFSFLSALLSGAAFAQPASVRWTGFGPGGGNVSSVAVDPTDPTVVYAAATASIYKSTDGGVTWQARLGPNHAIVAIDPSHPAIVYAGGTTIARSRDGGQTWRTVLADPHLLGNSIGSLAVSSAGTVFVGTADRLLRSTDFGRSWTTVLNDPTDGTGFHSLAVDPVDPRRIYAVTDFEIWRSTDGGDTWTQELNPPQQGFPNFDLGQLALAPFAPSTVYASLTNIASTVILRSDDAGLTWSEAGRIAANVAGALTVDPRSASRLYAAGDAGIYVSVDGGQTWTLLQAGLPTPFGRPLPILSLALAPSQPDLLFAGTVGWGVARSASAGARWRIGVETGLNAAVAPTLKFHPLRPSFVYVLQDNGRRTFRSTDGGRSWEPFARDITVRGLFDLAFDPVAADTLYAAGDGGIAKSTDGGGTWTPLGGPAAARVALLGRQTLLAGECGLSRSVDGGHTWAPVIPCVDDTTTGNEDHRTLLSIWTDPEDPRTAYVHFSLIGGTHDFFFQAFRSRDGGATWTQLPLSGGPTAFAVAPSDSRILYAVESSPVYRLVRSVDDGTSWKVVNPRLPADTSIGSSALAVDAVDPFELYLGAGDGLLISHDGGRTWELDRTPFEAGKTGVAQLWTDRTHPGLVWAASVFGGLYVGRFE